MLNLKKLIVPSLISFSTCTFILPLALWSNVDPANADQSQAVKICMDMRYLIKDLVVWTPTRNSLELKYAELRCHRYLHDKGTGRDCEKTLKANGGQLNLYDGRYGVGALYRQVCIITEDDDG
jgi:hypothetical protein